MFDTGLTVKTGYFTIVTSEMTRRQASGVFTQQFTVSFSQFKALLSLTAVASYKTFKKNYFVEFLVKPYKLDIIQKHEPSNPPTNVIVVTATATGGLTVKDHSHIETTRISIKYLASMTF